MSNAVHVILDFMLNVSALKNSKKNCPLKSTGGRKLGKNQASSSPVQSFCNVENVQTESYEKIQRIKDDTVQRQKGKNIEVHVGLLS